MHWILVSARHHPDHGGIGTSVRAFVAAAAAAGWRVDLVTRAGDDVPPGARVHAVRTPDEAATFASRIEPLRRIDRIRPYRYGHWSLAVAEALGDLDAVPDAIEFTDCQAEGLVALADPALRRRLGGAPALVHVHTPMFVGESYDEGAPRRFGRRVYHGWERRALGAADGFLAPSRLALDRALEHTGIHAPALVDVPPPLPVERPEPAVGRGIVMIGAYQPLKGADVLCRALNRLLAARPGLDATLAGPDTPTGPGGTSAREACARLLDPAVRPCCRLLGRLDQAAVDALLRRAAVVVVPSRHESWSMVAAEAVARGRPVVVSDAVGLAEAAPEVRTFPNGDDGALASVLETMLDDPAAEIGRSLRARAALGWAADPDRGLAARAAFVTRVRERADADRGRTPWTHRAGGIGPARMRRYLAAVERRERRVQGRGEAAA